ncbi:Vesicle transport through interaction with t-SNAREs like protein 1A [Tupaia chinensis]|uniref:Vesicle transport through interaction with t-SNAREs like protein 1A n=1 Tax=Tupaia chinensis TaxID=246437 RepID=L9KH92_TUPCH|nr:Vesicle transport through interaction with t-SNAREs like protein 1A [Tupaia chinensis]
MRIDSYMEQAICKGGVIWCGQNETRELHVNTAKDEKKQMVANVEKQLEEAKELLEQMDLEVREIPPQSRGLYSNRMRSYKQEMGKLETDFKRSRIAYSDEVRNELLGDDGNSSENQRAHLLDNTERLERSSRRLEAGYQIAVETGKNSESEQIVLLMHSSLHNT